jgi:putative addiction module CopG family antidote
MVCVCLNEAAPDTPYTWLNSLGWRVRRHILTPFLRRNPEASMPARNTLHVSATAELAAFVGEQVASGSYQISSEVVRAGLRLLADQHHQKEHQRVRRARSKPDAR